MNFKLIFHQFLDISQLLPLPICLFLVSLLYFWDSTVHIYAFFSQINLYDSYPFTYNFNPFDSLCFILNSFFCSNVFNLSFNSSNSFFISRLYLVTFSSIFCSVSPKTFNIVFYLLEYGKHIYFKVYSDKPNGP